MLGTSRTGIVFAGLLVAGSTLATAQPSGNFVVVLNELTRDAGDRDRAVVETGQALVLGDGYRSSSNATAKLMLNGNTLVSIGEDTGFRVADADAMTGIELSLGRLRVYAWPFVEARRQVEIRTSTLLTEVHDADVLVHVLEDGSCVVTAFSGSPVLRIHGRPESEVRLTGGQQAHVSSSGSISDPTSMGRDELDALWASVEAVPSAPRTLPGGVLRQWDVPTRSGGERLATDCISCPDRRTFDGREIDPGPGAAPVGTGSKSGAVKDR